MLTEKMLSFLSLKHARFVFLFTEVKMYLIILEEMHKYDVALEVINGPLGGECSC